LSPKLKYNWKGISQVAEKQRHEEIEFSDRVWIELVNEDIVGLYNDDQLRSNELFIGHFEHGSR
jgi:hypothetical protein